MRKLKKRLAALGVGLAVMATSVMSLGASAAVQLEWGQSMVMPNRGSFRTSKYLIQLSGIGWNQANVNHILNQQEATPNPLTMEFEYRPKGYKPSDIWNKNITGFESNLPGRYCEFDENDVTIGCRSLVSCNASDTYWGTITLRSASNPPSAWDYIFEIEYGQWTPASGIINDSLPIYYQQYNPAHSGQTHSWSYTS